MKDIFPTQAVKLTIAVESEDESLTGETDESYTIDVQKSPGKKVRIYALHHNLTERALEALIS